MKIYNSLSKKVEEFVPITTPGVSMYTCGMTVYDYAHIGHGRKYVGDDILRRVLEMNGYKVKHVQNVTDVGHLVSDADEGEDKLEKGAKKSGKTVWEVADFFTENFYSSMDKLNILRPHIICKATEHINEQIELIQKLFVKGIAYDTPEAVYFDVSKFKPYGSIFGQKLSEKKTAARGEVKTGEHKKNPADFALWFKRVGRFKDHQMHWSSPWGDGFPGWHIECSAMSMKYLGEQFDIHTGGEDHLPVHHPNEIAQAEGATGKHPFVRYWVHHAFLKVDGRKMSKSLNNFYTTQDVEEKGFEPLALRYLYLTAHYRDPLNFTWESLEASQKALKRLRKAVGRLAPGGGEKFLADFIAAVNTDLNMPKALAVVWEMVKKGVGGKVISRMDEILGLDLLKQKTEKIPDSVVGLVEERKKLREKGDFKKSDEIRKKIEELGYTIKDTAHGTETARN